MLDPTKVSDITTLIKAAVNRPIIDHNKPVTWKTIRSTQVSVSITETSITWNISVGGAYKFIVDGKKANTELPVKLVGDKWVLVDGLAEWKRILGINIPDFVLARFIAKNPRKPVDLIGEAIELMSRYGLEKKLLDLVDTDKIFEKIIQFSEIK